jgi:hypothetical protein
MELHRLVRVGEHDPIAGDDVCNRHFLAVRRVLLPLVAGPR